MHRVQSCMHGMLAPTKNIVIAALTSVLLLGVNARALDRTIAAGALRIHVSESGTGPTVVFESGMGEEIATWNDVRPEITKFAHTIAYERPGLGSSQATSSPRTVTQMAEDLHTILHAANAPSPYILVGHSLGGAIVQVFAHRYPAEVAGVVLVDPEDVRLLNKLHAQMSPQDWEARRKALDQAIPNLSPAQQAELHTVERGQDEVTPALPLPHVPLTVLTGTLKNPSFPGNPLEQDLKLAMHNDLVAATPGAKHILVPTSRHYIQNDAPQAVVQAVRDMVSQVAKR